VVDLFTQLDDSNDGVLDREEMAQFITDIVKSMGLSAAPTAETLEEIFCDVDYDGNEEVTLKEMEGFLKELIEKTYKSIIKKYS